MRRVALCVALAWAVWSPAANAGECYVSPSFEPGRFKLGTVKANVKRTLFGDGSDDTNWRAYVVAGDEVITAEVDGEFVCALYVGRKGEQSSGWLKSADLDIVPIAPLLPKSWIGQWTAGPNHNVEISAGKKPDWIAFSGTASWSLMGDGGEDDGGAHSGGIEGEAPIENDVAGATFSTAVSYLPFDEEAEAHYVCAVRLQVLSKRYLMVEDNGNCGGANVSTTAFYVRKN